MTTPLLLALDQGTSSSRAIVFGLDGQVVAEAQEEFPSHYPHEGWVEQDPVEIWSTILRTGRMAVDQADAPITALGITNQRETTLLWDRESGQPIYPAIVWQDRRTADQCAALKEAGAEQDLRARTGLLLDPYFSATKIAWILDHVEGARQAAEAGRLAFGTVDTWLIWQLTQGAVHATDATNASRTNLLNLHTGQWDPELLELFRIPFSLMPRVQDCASHFGTTHPDIFGHAIPICGVAGDQQAAAIGQSCFSVGDAKSTYGTGCFLLVNAGSTPPTSNHALLTTIGYQFNGERTYCLEGSIFTAGSGIKWLRDGLGLIDSAAETEALAASLPSNRGVYIVPALTGLGAPHWAPDARGLICGLTPQAGPAELVRAMLESAAYQTRDLITAIKADGVDVASMALDGGMVVNDWFSQFLADIVQVPLARPRNLETTAIGAAALAGLQARLIDGLAGVAALNAADRTFTPAMPSETRAPLLAGWQDAVARTLL